ncbi:MAG: hypothetical protein WC781_00755 [Candidatus Pacearchaeota archaeon]|jgi:hypothetical protein
MGEIITEYFGGRCLLKYHLELEDYANKIAEEKHGKFFQYRFNGKFSLDKAKDIDYLNDLWVFNPCVEGVFNDFVETKIPSYKWITYRQDEKNIDDSLRLDLVINRKLIHMTTTAISTRVGGIFPWPLFICFEGEQKETYKLIRALEKHVKSLDEIPGREGINKLLSNLSRKDPFAQLYAE